MFDEINTCNYLGLLADLISNRKFQNKLIHPNVRLFATCNPYRILQIDANLTNRDMRYGEEQINLVYPVKPLPDQILDYVWDYGKLQQNDEKTIMILKSMIEMFSIIFRKSRSMS